MPFNEEVRENARKALAVYVKRSGAQEMPLGKQAADLIADLMYLVYKESEDSEEAAERVIDYALQDFQQDLWELRRDG